jgi:hypothetical protein
MEVDAALAAGNKLRTIYALACGTLSVVRDSKGQHQIGSCGLKTSRAQPGKRPREISYQDITIR